MGFPWCTEPIDKIFGKILTSKALIFIFICIELFIVSPCRHQNLQAPSSVQEICKFVITKGTIQAILVWDGDGEGEVEMVLAERGEKFKIHSFIQQLISESQ